MKKLTSLMAKHGWIAFIIMRIFRPLRNFLFANIQAIFKLPGRSLGLKWLDDMVQKSRGLLREGKYTIKQHSNILESLVRWEEDPWGGALDFKSLPWVTIYSGGGDCEDIAAISSHIFRKIGKKARTFYIWSKDGSGHVILIVNEGEVRWLVSNTKVFGPFANDKDAINYFYGDNTMFHYEV